MGHQMNPKVIIVELELPGEIRGWDVVRALKGNDKTCRRPVITCSWPQDAEVFATVGEVHGMLHKPDLHFDDLENVLKNAGVLLDRELDPHDDPSLPPMGRDGTGKEVRESRETDLRCETGHSVTP